MEIKSSTAIITGSGTGIGRAIALAFGRHGANVVCAARRKAKLEETVRLIEAEGGVGLAVPTDVTERAQVRAMVAAALDRFGRIDLLFNNAGSFRCIAGVHEVDPALWWGDVTVNLLGPLLCCREVLPHLIERDAGIVINMDGGRPVGGTGYASSKAALMELSRVLVEELKMIGSRVIVLRAGPGFVRTDMTELQANTEAGRRWIPRTAERIEAGTTLAPEEIARKTIEVVRRATPDWSGKAFGPRTDISEW